ncbi:unnamed protein product [Diatraea saccharalis]|uniref:Uncharacterized protein n=1 Tax=Diatraea saccharalis TaxID=40085 RepID=A0A9N9RG53_9NEOP|nr:unnamed protein product [Diatraea saccharalis]
MKTTLIFLAVVAMTSARGVNFVDNNPPNGGSGNEVNFVNNNPPNGGSEVNFVNNAPPNDQNGQEVHFVDNGNIDPSFGQPVRPPNGGYEPIDASPAFVQGYRPNIYDNPLARGGK